MRNCWHWCPERGVNVTLCGMGCINLTKNSAKTPDIHCSYNKKMEKEENFIEFMKKIENVFKV